MRNLKQFCRSLALVALMIVTALAQNPIPPDVNILIQPRQVQFVAQKAIQEMRFQVFDEQGHLVYDTGALTEPELKWNLRHGNGGELAGGLYAYKLTIKEQGKETAEEKRGHFIIERAEEQKSDRLWITSQGVSGVGTDVQGTELTVAASGKETVAGTRNTDRKVSPANDNSTDKNTAKTNAAVAAATFDTASSGTVNRIAKWVATNKIGDSVLFESNGNVGIGTSTPGFPLSFPNTIGDKISLWGTSGAHYGFGIQGALLQIHTPTNVDDIALGFGRSAAFTETMRVKGNGNVGIGTANPLARLYVRTTSANTADNTATFAAPTIGPNFSHIHYGIKGDWYIRSAAGSGKVILQDTGGYVGIGTNNPVAKLHAFIDSGVAMKAESQVGVGLVASTNSTGAFSAGIVATAPYDQLNNASSTGILASGRTGISAYGKGAQGPSGMSGDITVPGVVYPGLALYAEAGPFADAAKFVGKVTVDGEVTVGGSLQANSVSADTITPKVLSFSSSGVISKLGAITLASGAPTNAGIQPPGIGLNLGTSGGIATPTVNWIQGTGTTHLSLNPVSGNVSIGKLTPVYKLDVAGTIGTSGGVVQTSDQRFKQNVRTLDNALDKVLNLRGVSYAWKRSENPAMNFEAGTQLGFIAQEVEKVLPEAVKKDSQGMYTMNYTAVVPVLVEAVKQQQQNFENWQKNFAATEQQFDKLRAENANLKEQNATLEARLAALEQAMLGQKTERVTTRQK